MSPSIERQSPFRFLVPSLILVLLPSSSLRNMAVLSSLPDALPALSFKNCAGALLVFLAVKYLYRGYLSPVARQHIPGPPLARFTRAWSTLHFLGFRRIFATEEAHKKYGPIVRIAPDYISINRPSRSLSALTALDPPTLQLIYNERSFAKDKFYKGIEIQHTDKCAAPLRSGLTPTV